MAIDYSLSAIPKVKPSIGKRFVKGIVARLRSRKKRKDDTYAAGIREQVAARDGYCRHGYDVSPGDRFSQCSGPSEWAHFGPWRRARTRGLKPEDQHTTAGSLMLCRRCHQAYDSGRLVIIAKSPRLCDGPLRYREIGQ
jgi:hypothetical protein